MKISIKEIQEYSFCPRLYFLKKETKINPSLEEYYNEILHKIMYRFLSMCQDREIIVPELKKIWNSAAIAQKKTHKFAYYNPINWKSNLSEFNKKGVEVLNYLINVYSKSVFSILAVNEPYTVKLTKDIEITGQWELIEENPKTNAIGIIIFKTHDHINHVSIKQDFKSVFDCIAFRKIFDKNEDYIAFKSFNSDKIQTADINDFNIKVVINCISNICKAIDAGINYKYISYKCKTCTMRMICEKEE